MRNVQLEADRLLQELVEERYMHTSEWTKLEYAIYVNQRQIMSQLPLF